MEERRRYEDKIEVILNNIQNDLHELRFNVSKNDLEIHDIRKDIRGLVNAWNTASSVALFLKWMAGVGAAIGVLYAFLVGKLFHM